MSIFDNTYPMSPAQSFGAALMAGSGPSRMPIPLMSAIGQGMLSGQDAYQQGMLRGLQAQGMQTNNALSNLTLQGYKNMQGLLSGAAPTGQAAIASGMPSSPQPDPGGYAQFAKDAGMQPTQQPAPDPGGYQQFATDAGIGAPPPKPAEQPAPPPQAPATGLLNGQQAQGPVPVQGNPPPPLFNMGNIYQQYKMAASTPGMQPVAAQLLSLIEKGTPEGAYVGTDGGIYGRPGYNQFVQGQSAAKEAGAAPYKAVESLLSQAGRSVRLGPGEIATTGLEAMPAPFQNAIMGLLGGQRPGASPAPQSPTIQPASATAPSQAGSAVTSAPGTSSIGFPTQPTRAPGGGIQSPISLQGKIIAEQVLPKQFEKAQTEYENAQGMQTNLDMIDHAIESLNQTGLTSTGTGASTKFAVMKGLNSLAETAGIEKPFDATKIGTWEDFNKESTRMGFALAKTLGSREAMMIVQQAIAAVPNANNTYLGSRLVSSSLRQAAQRQSDYYEFLQSYAMQHGGNTMGADVAFNKSSPVKSYTDKAVVNSVPPNVMSAAPDAARAYLANHPDTVSDFIKHYGGQ